MLKPNQGDYLHIITDMRGTMDCYSKQVREMTGIVPTQLKESDINIQFIIPELATLFGTVRQGIRRRNFTRPENVMLVVP